MADTEQIEDHLKNKRKGTSLVAVAKIKNLYARAVNGNGAAISTE